MGYKRKRPKYSRRSPIWRRANANMSLIWTLNSDYIIRVRTKYSDNAIKRQKCALWFPTNYRLIHTSGASSFMFYRLLWFWICSRDYGLSRLAKENVCDWVSRQKLNQLLKATNLIKRGKRGALPSPRFTVTQTCFTGCSTSPVAYNSS